VLARNVSPSIYYSAGAEAKVYASFLIAHVH